MSNRDIFLLLEDMLESAFKIQRYCDGLNLPSFIDDKKLSMQ